MSRATPSNGLVSVDEEDLRSRLEANGKADLERTIAGLSPPTLDLNPDDSVLNPVFVQSPDELRNGWYDVGPAATQLQTGNVLNGTTGVSSDRGSLGVSEVVDGDTPLFTKLDLEGPEAEARRTYVGRGNRDVETGQFSNSVFSEESLRETQRDSFSTEAELSLYSSETKSVLFENKLSQISFGDADFGMTMGADASVVTSRSQSAVFDKDGFDLSFGRGISADITYYSGHAQSPIGSLDFGAGTNADAGFNAHMFLNYSPTNGLKGALEFSGEIGASAITGSIRGTTDDIDLGLLNLKLEGQADGHLVGIGATGNVGVKTLETRLGIRATVGAGLTALVGGKLKLTTELAIAPRVVSAYESAVSYTADQFEKYLGPHN